jgi:hypothetical protein
VDENLFYKGVNKRSVHGARLHQTHSLSEPIPTKGPEKLSAPNAEDNLEHPPYPFESGSSLLALTRKYNVGAPDEIPLDVVSQIICAEDDYCTDCI